MSFVFHVFCVLNRLDFVLGLGWEIFCVIHLVEFNRDDLVWLGHVIVEHVHRLGLPDGLLQLKSLGKHSGSLFLLALGDLPLNLLDLLLKVTLLLYKTLLLIFEGILSS